MDDAGFILASYVLTFGGIIAYAAYVLRRGRKAAAQIPDDSKPWL